MNDGLVVYVDLGNEVKGASSRSSCTCDYPDLQPLCWKGVAPPDPSGEEFYDSVSSVISRYRIKKKLSG